MEGCVCIPHPQIGCANISPSRSTGVVATYQQDVLLINYPTVLLSVPLYASTQAPGASGSGPFWALLCDWIDFDEFTH